MKLLQFSPKRMRDARDGRGWSQSQLARAMVVREQQITRWESGQNVPNANAVAALAQATGRDIEFFYAEVQAEDDEEAALPSLDQLLAQRVEVLVQRRMKELTPATRGTA